MATRLRIAPVLLAFLGAGCFSYRAATVAELGPGETVRAYLTPDQAREVGEVVSLQGRHVTGTLVQTAEDRLLLDVPVAGQGTGGQTLSQRVAVPVTGVLEVQERFLNGWKTAFLVGGIAAVVGGLISWQLSEQDSSPLGGSKDPPDAARIPIIRIGVPLPGGP